jgi:hypothetical protein
VRQSYVNCGRLLDSPRLINSFFQKSGGALLKNSVFFEKIDSCPVSPEKSEITDYEPAGSNEVRRPNTGPRILPIAPEIKNTTKTIIQTLVHSADTTGFIPGIIHGQILLPSRGGMGNRLITASIALIKNMLTQINSMVQ